MAKKNNKLETWKDKYYDRIQKIQEGIKAKLTPIRDEKGELESIEVSDMQVSVNPIDGEQLQYFLQSTSKRVKTGEDAFPVYSVLGFSEKTNSPYAKVVMDYLKKTEKVLHPKEHLEPLFKELLQKLNTSTASKEAIPFYVINLASDDKLSKELADFLENNLIGARNKKFEASKVWYSITGIEKLLDKATRELTDQEKNQKPSITFKSSLDRRGVPGEDTTLAILDYPLRTDEEALAYAYKKTASLRKPDTKVSVEPASLLNHGFTQQQIKRFNKENNKPYLTPGSPEFLKYFSEKTSESRAIALRDGYGYLQNRPYAIYRDWTEDFKSTLEYINWKQLSMVIKRHRLLKTIKGWKEKGYNEIQISKKLGGSNISSLKSKYDFGFYPDMQGTYTGKFLEEDGLDELVNSGVITNVQKAIIEGLRGDAQVVFVDDNVHSGTDFRKIGKGLEFLRDEMVELGMIQGGITGKLAPGERTGNLFNRRFAAGDTVAQNFAGVVLYRVDGDKILDTDLKGIKRLEKKNKEKLI